MTLLESPLTLAESLAARLISGLQPAPVDKQTMRFRDYVTEAWRVVEPATLFVGGYHVDAIAEHLQAISDGDLHNLIINIPPRHSKSTLVSVLWPTWEWIDNPHLRWLCISYAQALSTRDSVKRRRVIQSRWYQDRWELRYRLTGDQNEKMRFENDKTGVMIATSVGGVNTGEGGSRVIVDDPSSAEQAASDTQRENANDWWDSTMATRADQPDSTARVIVMQRLHERDLTGHILERMHDGGQVYDHLVLPAEYEPRVQVCVAGLQHDPRTEAGELLSPERFSAETIRLIALNLQDRAPGQLQQRPAPPGGAIYQRVWWVDGRNRYDINDAKYENDALARWLFFDTAMKDQERNDFTACLCLEMRPDRYRLAVREVWRSHLEFPDLVEDIKATAEKYSRDGKLRNVVIEDKGSGTSAVQTLQKAADAWLAPKIKAFMPTGSKVYRARQAAYWCSQDMLLLPHPSEQAPWLFDFEDELLKFPTAAHDDMADTLSMAVIFLEWWLRDGIHAPQASATAEAA